VAGVVGGFTGLTAGVNYYLANTAGTISTTPGTYKYRVGVSISTTEILLMPGIKQSEISDIGNIEDAIVGDDVVYTEATTHQDNQNSYTKLCEKRIGRSGDYRITWQGKITTGATAYFKVFQNGTEVGVEKTTDSSVYVDFSDDVTGWNRGDLIQIYGHRNPASETYTITNFTIKCGNPI
jgi:hypothetical protein